MEEHKKSTEKRTSFAFLTPPPGSRASAHSLQSHAHQLLILDPAAASSPISRATALPPCSCSSLAVFYPSVVWPARARVNTCPRQKKHRLAKSSSLRKIKGPTPKSFKKDQKKNLFHTHLKRGDTERGRGAEGCKPSRRGEATPCASQARAPALAVPFPSRRGKPHTTIASPEAHCATIWRWRLQVRRAVAR